MGKSAATSRGRNRPGTLASSVAAMPREEATGTYLDPPHLCAVEAMPDYRPPNSSTAAAQYLSDHGTKIAATLAVAERPVFVTHGGGVFVPPTGVLGRDGYNHDHRERDDRHAAFVINLLICELNVRASAICAPLGAEGLCHALVEDGIASLWVATGRTQRLAWATQAQVRDGSPVAFAWPRIPREILDACDGAPRARRLAELAAELPTFVCSAVFARHHGRDAEAIVFAWVVVEQVISYLWRTEILPTSRNSRHRDRLKDTRSWTASSMAELLWRADLLSDDIYDAVQDARSHRNDFAHHAHINDTAAADTFTALHNVLALLIGEIA